MKKLSTYLFLLLFSFSAPSFADDIRDFQIEGMSIGSSALDYFSEEQIKSSRMYTYKSDKYYSVDLWDDNLKNFKAIQGHFKKNDNQYKFHGISGALTFGLSGVENINTEKECVRHMRIIEKDIDNLFSNAKKQNQDYVGNDLDPKAMTFEVIYLLEDGEIWMQCVKWSKKYKEEGNFYDNLRLTILNKQFTIWMDTKAY